MGKASKQRKHKAEKFMDIHLELPKGVQVVADGRLVAKGCAWNRWANVSLGQ